MRDKNPPLLFLFFGALSTSNIGAKSSSLCVRVVVPIKRTEKIKVFIRHIATIAEGFFEAK